LKRAIALGIVRSAHHSGRFATAVHLSLLSGFQSAPCSRWIGEGCHPVARQIEGSGQLIDKYWFVMNQDNARALDPFIVDYRFAREDP
jgi:hypothetical protein